MSYQTEMTADSRKTNDRTGITWRAAGLLLLVALGLAGCASKTKSKMDALATQQAYLAGQNAAMQQQLARQESPFPTVTVNGHVQNNIVPWVVGLTLTQAIATANYQDSQDPTVITVMRQGQISTVDPKLLFDGPAFTLAPGDVIEIH